MNAVALALHELRRAEEELADEYTKVGERLAVEHDVWYQCKQFAQQCHLHVETLAKLAAKYDADLAPPGDAEVGETMTAALRHRLSELLGRRPESGLLLLRSLRQLFVQAHEVSFMWVCAGQIAQAARDAELLGVVDALHRETLTQIKWLKTQAKIAAPQALVGATPPQHLPGLRHLVEAE